MLPTRFPLSAATFLVACGASPGPTNASTTSAAPEPSVRVDASTMQELVTKASAAWQQMAFGEGGGGVLELRLAPGRYTGMDLTLADPAASHNVDLVVRGGPGVVLEGATMHLAGNHVVVDGLRFEGNTSGTFLHVEPRSSAIIRRVAWTGSRAGDGGGMQASHALMLSAVGSGASVAISDLWCVECAAGSSVIGFSSMNGTFGPVSLDRVAASSPSVVASLTSGTSVQIRDSVVATTGEVPAVQLADGLSAQIARTTFVLGSHHPIPGTLVEVDVAGGPSTLPAGARTVATPKLSMRRWRRSAEELQAPSREDLVP